MVVSVKLSIVSGENATVSVAHARLGLSSKFDILSTDAMAPGRSPKVNLLLSPKLI